MHKKGFYFQFLIPTQCILMESFPVPIYSARQYSPYFDEKYQHQATPCRDQTVKIWDGSIDAERKQLNHILTEPILPIYGANRPRFITSITHYWKQAYVCIFIQEVMRWQHHFKLFFENIKGNTESEIRPKIPQDKIRITWCTVILKIYQRHVITNILIYNFGLALFWIDIIANYIL